MRQKSVPKKEPATEVVWTTQRGLIRILALPARGVRERHHTCLASRISMASTSGSLRQRLAFLSAVARLPSHSAWLNAATPAGQNLLGGCAAKWITMRSEERRVGKG